jgi:hypothetical protein
VPHGQRNLGHGRLQRAFDDQVGNLLDGKADRLEGTTPKQEANLEKASEHLNQEIKVFRSEYPQDVLSPEAQAYLALSSRAEYLASSLNDAFSASGV